MSQTSYKSSQGEHGTHQHPFASSDTHYDPMHTTLTTETLDKWIVSDSSDLNDVPGIGPKHVQHLQSVDNAFGGPTQQILTTGDLLGKYMSFLRGDDGREQNELFFQWLGNTKEIIDHRHAIVQAMACKMQWVTYNQKYNFFTGSMYPTGMKVVPSFMMKK